MYPHGGTILAAMTEATDTQNQRSLLGLRPPAELASGPLPDRVAAPAPAEDRGTGPGANRPARPDYPVVSSGWDDEDGDASKRTDLMTAVRALVMLMVLMVGLGLLITR
jgi:hypothetical protein